MRRYEVILCSGAKVNVTAQLMVDDPENEAVLFYHDDAGHNAAAAIKRADIAGMIFHAQKASAIPSW